jgi:hypothetical protein
VDLNAANPGRGKVTGRSEIRERGPVPTPSLRAALADAADLIQEVLDTAESAAGRIVEDAEDRASRIRRAGEADAEHRLRASERVGSPDGEERALTRRLEGALDLMTEVLERAELIARDADALRIQASRLRASFAGLVGGPTDYPSSTSASEPPPAPAGAPPGDRGDAQLLAVQMALAGRSDDEIERRLRQQFSGEEVEVALDVVGKLGADRR